MPNFEFATAQRIVFGNGKINELPNITAEFGKRVLLVTGSTPARHTALVDGLRAAHFDVTVFAIAGEPTLQSVVQGRALAQANACQLVVAVGGGSVIDAGKAIAALATNAGDILDYLEVIGRGIPIAKDPLPFIAVPTTAGSGAEVTRNAVLASAEHGVKVSLRSPRMLPRVALLDPELTHPMPPSVTAATGMDALAQLIEPFVCSRANPFTDALAREGMTRAAQALPRAYANGNDAEAREDMMLASVWGGMCLANSGLGAVHGFAAPIGGMFAAPHGAVCAQLLPWVMAANIGALQAAQDHAKLRRYDEVAQHITQNKNATRHDGVTWMHDLCAALHISALGSYGMSAQHVPVLVQKAAAASSMAANPAKLSPAQLSEILLAAM